jgi:hypothetical protein
MIAIILLISLVVLLVVLGVFLFAVLNQYLHETLVGKR